MVMNRNVWRTGHISRTCQDSGHWHKLGWGHQAQLCKGGEAEEEMSCLPSQPSAFFLPRASPFGVELGPSHFSIVIQWMLPILLLCTPECRSGRETQGPCSPSTMIFTAEAKEESPSTWVSCLGCPWSKALPSHLPWGSRFNKWIHFPSDGWSGTCVDCS